MARPPLAPPSPALLWTAQVCIWIGNAAGVIMLPAVAVTLYTAGEPGKDAITMLAGGTWFATGGLFIGLGRGVPMLLLGRSKVGGILGIIAKVQNGPEPVRQGPMVRVRGAVFAMAGLLMAPLGLALALKAVFDLVG